MQFSRRVFLTISAAAGLSGCAPGAPRSQTARPTSRPATLPEEMRPRPNAAFSAWLDGFRPRARAAGITDTTLNAALGNAGFIPGVVARDGNQIQTRRTFEEYLSIIVSDERIANGRTAYARNRATIDAIAARYNVEPLIITAIWGAESAYGDRRGLIPVISSTATLAFDGRRGEFYERQLIAALRILQRGDTRPAQMVGSWAGAMGHTQFIPTSFEDLAVDFNGDGRRDIWGDDPTDALASTANYLSRNGWRQGLKWGAEEGTSNLSGRRLEPQAGGVVFTVTANFNVIKTYNNSDFYAAGIGILADRIGGGAPLQGTFPPDENGLTRDDRLSVQRALAQRGYDIGTIDGVIGPMSQAALRNFQSSEGLPMTGVADRATLNALR